jgi:hypothetical protein
MKSGEQSGVDGTPSLFIDGLRYRGPQDIDILGNVIRSTDQMICLIAFTPALQEVPTIQDVRGGQDRQEATHA